MNLASPLLIRCRAGETPCASESATKVREKTWLLTIPAGRYVRVGPYESLEEGFRVSLPGLAFRRGRQGLKIVSIAPMVQGRLPPLPLVAQFHRVEPSRARAWRARNNPSRLRARMVFTFGDVWSDEPRRGITIHIKAVQVYNTSTGDVLLDSTRAPTAMPDPPPRLSERLRLWEPSMMREALWATTDGREMLLSVQTNALHNEPGLLVPTLCVTEGARRKELIRFRAGDRSASLAVAPHGANRLLVIFTSRRPRPGRVGNGVVTLLQWIKSQNQLFIVARWEGTNRDTPPEWVRDPNALPTPQSRSNTKPKASANPNAGAKPKTRATSKRSRSNRAR